MFKNLFTVGLRNLLGYKGYSAINVFGLAIGIACCVVILLYVQDELSYDQHHEKKDRIYRLVESATVGARSVEVAITPPPWAPVLVKDYPEIERITRIKPPDSRWLVRYKESRFYEQKFVFVDSSVFDIFTIPLVQGNAKSALAEPHTVVLSESMVDKYFGNENPIGKVLSADDIYKFTVTGIMRNMPKNSHFHFDFLASYASLGPNKLYNEPSSMQNQGFDHTLYTYLMLREGYAPEDLENELPGFLDRYLGELLSSVGIEARPYLQPITDIHLHSNLEAEIEANSNITYVYIFSSLAGFILLIACVNFINLSTARSARRAQEVGIRKVLGALRNQLIRQFIGESILFSLIALVIALGIVHLLLPQFNLLSGKALAMDYQSKWLVPVLVAIALVTGIVAGGHPAFILSSFRPVAILDGAMKKGVSHSLLRKTLITFQFVVSIIMIVGTVVILDQLMYMQNKKLGFNKDHVMVVRLPDEEALKGYQSYKNAILQYPEVLNVSSSSSVPGGQAILNLVTPEGVGKDQSPVYQVIQTDFDFIETLGIKMASGRTFSREFSSDFTACLINEAAVQSLGWTSPIGRTFIITGAPDTVPPLNVIGVMEDFHNQSLHHRIEPLIVLFSESNSFMVIRLVGGALSRGLAILQAEWRETYPDHPAMEFTFLDQDLEQLYLAEHRLGSVFISGAVLSILIACLGLLGLASYMAEQRTGEIGVRKVLGATITNVILLLSKDFTKLVLLAFVVGAPAGYYLMRAWLEDFPYRNELSLWVFVFAGFATLVITLLTVGYHAVKAATANPVDALRAE